MNHATLTPEQRSTWEHLIFEHANQMRQHYPQLGPRLDAAIERVQSGAVSIGDNGVGQVASRTDLTKSWTIENGRCSCPDAVHRAPEGRCCHRIALGLYKQVLASLDGQLDWQPELPLAAPLPGAEAPRATATLPEAAFSVCLKGQRKGVEVLLTVRGGTRAEWQRHMQEVLDVEAQLDQLCGLFDPPAAKASADGTPVCPVHGVAMVKQSNERGSWWSHRLGDGTWCKGRS